MFNPCCCDCSGPYSDNFDRADSTTIGADYTEDVGNFEIFSNQLKISTSNAQMRLTGYAATHPFYISSRAKGTADGDEFFLGFALDYTTTDWIAACLTVGSSAKIRILENLAGTVRVVGEVAVTAANNTFHDLKVYFSGFGRIGVALNGTLLTVCATSPLTFVDCVVVFGTRTITGDVYFDDFNLYDPYSAVPGKTSCERIPDYCYPFYYPLYIGTTVSCTIAGAVDAAGVFYSALNGTYTLTFDPFIGDWRISGLSIGAGAAGTWTTVKIRSYGSAPRNYLVDCVPEATFGAAQWEKNYGDTFNTTLVGDHTRTLAAVGAHGGTVTLTF